MSSAICFNLDQSKILLSGNRLIQRSGCSFQMTKLSDISISCLNSVLNRCQTKIVLNKENKKTNTIFNKENSKSDLLQHNVCIYF